MNKKVLVENLKKNLIQGATFDSKVNQIVESLNISDSSRNWVNDLTRDDIIEIVATTKNNKKIIEKICDLVKDDKVIRLKESIERVGNKKKLNESVKEAKEVYTIKYWVDEEARDEGLSDVYLEKFANLSEAKRIADKLFDEYASVEVVKNLDTEDEEVVYGLYPEEDDFDDSLEESYLDDEKEPHMTKEEFFNELVNDYGFEEELAEQITNQLDDKKIYVCVKDRQGGNFGLGRAQNELEWAITALGWGDSDGFWYDLDDEEADKFFLEAFKSGNLIPYIDDLWEITIVPEDETVFIYQFPYNLTEEELQELWRYDLELLGQVGENGLQYGDYIVRGKLGDLENYCNEYLAYQMNPDYLYTEDEFDTELLESKEDKEYSIEIDLLKYKDEIENEFELKSFAEEYNLYIDMSSIGENHKCYDVIGKKEDLKDFCNDVLGAKLEEFEVIEESLERNRNSESLTDSFNNFRNEHKNNLTESITERDIKRGNKFKDGAGNFYVIKNVDYDDRVHFDYVGKDGKVIFSNSLYMNSFLPKLQFNKSELVKESREEHSHKVRKMSDGPLEEEQNDKYFNTKRGYGNKEESLEEDWIGYDVDKGLSDKLKDFLRQNKIYFEPSENGNKIHFEIKIEKDDIKDMLDTYVKEVNESLKESNEVRKLQEKELREDSYEITDEDMLNLLEETDLEDLETVTLDDMRNW